MSKRRAIKLIPVIPPMGQVFIHQVLEPFIMLTLNKVDKFMDDNIFQT